MTRSVFLLMMLLFANACTFRVREPSNEERNQITSEVLALTNEIRAAAEAADAEGLFKYHSNAPDAMHIIDGKKYTRGQMVANYRDVYAGVASQEINIGNPTVKVISTDLVLVVSQGDFKTNSRSGTSLTGGVAWTYLWQKQNESWVLLHAHQSFPGPISRTGNQGQ